MIWPLILAMANVQVCNASVFAHEGDSLAGGVAPHLGREVRPTDNGIAHRRLPLGSDVLIVNIRTGDHHRATVVDRGPFGRVGKKWRNGAALYRERRRKGLPAIRTGWRGCVDMTPRVRRKLRHNGFEPVILLPLVPPIDGQGPGGIGWEYAVPATHLHPNAGMCEASADVSWPAVAPDHGG